jgi:hypothetical protein
MSSLYENPANFVTAIDDLNIDSGADTYEFVPGDDVEVFRAKFISTTDVVKASGSVVIEVRKRVLVGSSTGSTDYGDWNLITAQTLAAGSVAYADLTFPVAAATAEDGSTRNVEPTGPIPVDLGQSLLFTVSTAATSGAGILVIDYFKKGSMYTLKKSTTVKGTVV